ncbi:MAG: chlorite dismutase family protein [Chloroflexota bacterium]|nr:MAG: chlorite dismutase [Chloroflexota bacterium]
MTTTFVQFLFYRLDPAWRRLSEDERHCRATELSETIESQEGLTTYAYNTTGLKAGTDLLLWRHGADVAEMQAASSRLHRTSLGEYLDISASYLGLIRPSNYVRRQTSQEQAVLSHERGTYLVVYPFTKTIEWHLLGAQTRQGMMNEHIKVGHEYGHIRQVLVHSFGLDDQEFIVAYEAEDLLEFQSLVMDLRATDGRKHTLSDTPIYTCVHRPLREAIELLA